MMFRIGIFQMWSRGIMEVKKTVLDRKRTVSAKNTNGNCQNIQFCNQYLVKAYKELSSVAEVI